MSYQLSRNMNRKLTYNPECVEEIILKLADTFKIEVVWDDDLAFLTGVMAVAGGLLGGFFGGRAGAALGAGMGGAAGIGMAKVKPLREVWSQVKEKLHELLYIVYNFLRKLDASDYLNAFHILMACVESRQQLVKTIIAFITDKLQREVLSSITAA